ncbi:hypothetical protein [Loigolactobacillus zhaoyuanensis]|uniref:Uncharacterized protein n=1 Tax=Loigolactobacillus zhaoyuanensis TaxID=2486017 RepID=A0ABW8UBD5_9LACO|nr:hypothetical protein [Loigolactobacillus zhaoyuanensis]
MQLLIADQDFFARLRAGQVFFFKDTLVLFPFAEDYQQTLHLVEQDYQALRAEIGPGTFNYQITPDKDLAQARIQLSAVSADHEKTVTKTYYVFLDNVD